MRKKKQSALLGCGESDCRTRNLFISGDGSGSRGRFCVRVCAYVRACEHASVRVKIKATHSSSSVQFIHLPSCRNLWCVSPHVYSPRDFTTPSSHPHLTTTHTHAHTHTYTMTQKGGKIHITLRIRVIQFEPS